jgi:hypothetical protein
MATVTYTLSTEPLEQLRIAVRRCNALDVARYRRHLREVDEWAQARLGKGVGELTDEEFDAYEEDGTLPMFRVGQDRAQMLAALDCIERRVEDGEWTPAQLPDEWADVEGFATQMPATLYYAWLRAVHECNPGLFGPISGDDEKKSGAASVTW